MVKLSMLFHIPVLAAHSWRTAHQVSRWFVSHPLYNRDKPVTENVDNDPHPQGTHFSLVAPPNSLMLTYDMHVLQGTCSPTGTHINHDVTIVYEKRS